MLYFAWISNRALVIIYRQRSTSKLGFLLGHVCLLVRLPAILVDKASNELCEILYIVL